MINYVYDYNKDYLLNYSRLVYEEFERRGYKIKNWDNFRNYFSYSASNDSHVATCFFGEHDENYLKVCFFNLYEKYIRGQKDFDKQTFDNLVYFVSFKTTL